MVSSSQHCTQIFVASAVVFLLAVTVTPPAQAQTLSVLHNFSVADGNTPTATLLLDRAGNLYGTMEYGGYGSCKYGSAFQFKSTKSGWVMNPIHCFSAPLGGNDGALPINYGGLTIGPDGGLYGTTNEGGILAGSGTSSLGIVFKLSPPATACFTVLCPWTLTVLYKFKDTPDGSYPQGNVVFDSAGNLYGTTSEGGAYGYGSVFKLLTPTNGGWTESILQSFSLALLEAGLVIDGSGNLYGTDPYGGNGSNGSVFQLTPSGSGWTQNVLYKFTNGADGRIPVAGLVLDQAGNLYGSTFIGGESGGGTIFQLSPSGGTWTFNTLFSLRGSGGPQSSLTIDAAGNLYGTTTADGAHGGGSVFKLTPSAGGWTFTSLHDFFRGDEGGLFPLGGVTLDLQGNLYGTTSEGGANNEGVIWEITP